MLTYFINEMNTFSDLYRVTNGMREYHRSLVFEEMINLVFLYHPIYASITKEYHIYKTLKPETKEYFGPDTPTNLQFIRTYEDEWCTIQSVFNLKNDRVVWENHDLYKSDKFHKHFFITNSDIKNVLPIENIDKNKTIYVSGLFFNMLKPEWFKYLKNQLYRRLFMFQPIIPSPQYIDIINDITSTYTNKCTVKILEQDFTPEFMFNHYWINKELNNKVTIVSFETFPQLLQFMNIVSYQKLINNFTHQYLTIYNPDNFDEIYCSDGLLLLHNTDDVVDRLKKMQNSKIENCNISIVITYNCTDILIESLKTLNIIPNMLIAYPHMSDNVTKLFDDEIITIEKRLLIVYPKGSQQKYIINKGSIYDDSEYHKYINNISSKNVNNDVQEENTQENTQKPVKFKKTNIMDYLDTNNISDQDDEDYDELLKEVDDEYDIKHNMTYSHKDKNEWENTYQELLDWTEKYGTLPIKDDTIDLTIPDNQLERNLSDFMDEQLKRSKQNKLTPEQIKKLELIHGWKDLDTNQKINKLWLTKYKQLYFWVLDHKELPKQNSTDEVELSLYSFLHNQSMKIKNNDMSEEKKYKMGLIKGWDNLCEKYKQQNDWIRCFNQLKNLVNITQKYPQYVMGISYEEYELYKFIELQRLNYKFKNIPLTKIKELESIPNWNWKFPTNNNNSSTLWDILYKELKTWIIKNNAIPEVTELDIPTEEVTKLALFVNIQKFNKLLDKLNDNQIKKLEILPLWNWKTKNDEFFMDDLWDFSYKKLQLYESSFKDFPNIEYNNNEAIDIALFMDMQKKAYKLGLLNEEKIQQLESFKFWNWTIHDKENFKIDKVNNDIQKNKNTQKNIEKNTQKNDEPKVPKNIIQDDDPEKMVEWEKKYNEVLKWCKTHDYLPKRNMRDEYEKDLYYFLDKHKKYQKYANLSKYKVEKMEALPGWCWIGQKPIKIENKVKTEVVRDEWNITYIELSKWIKTNNKLPTFNTADENEKKLFEFCNNQIENKIDDKLTPIQIQKLEILKYWTWIKAPVVNAPNTTPLWTTKYEQLREWATKHKKLPVYGSNNKLQEMLLTFIYNNRCMYNKQRLNNDQIKKLEALPNWSWTKVEK